MIYLGIECIGKVVGNYLEGDNLATCLGSRGGGENRIELNTAERSLQGSTLDNVHVEHAVEDLIFGGEHDPVALAIGEECVVDILGNVNHCQVVADGILLAVNACAQQLGKSDAWVYFLGKGCNRDLV